MHAAAWVCGLSSLMSALEIIFSAASFYRDVFYNVSGVKESGGTHEPWSVYPRKT